MAGGTAWRRVSLPSPYIYTTTSLSGQPAGAGAILTATVAGFHAPGVPTGSVQFWSGYGTLVGTAPLVNGAATLAVASVTRPTPLPRRIWETAFSRLPPRLLPQRQNRDQRGALLVGESRRAAAARYHHCHVNAAGSELVPAERRHAVVRRRQPAPNRARGERRGPVHGQFFVDWDAPPTATYSGDANFTGSTSPVLNQSVSLAQTAVTLSSSALSITYGQPVQFTATVSPAGATGTIQFLDGGVSLGSATIAGGAATLAVASLGAGSHSITAQYAGDSANQAAGSAALLQNVSQATPVFTVASSRNPSIAGQAVTFTVTMTPVSYGAPLSLEISQPPASLQATWSAAGTTITTAITTADLAAGTHTVTGVWGGDANIAAGSSAVLGSSCGRRPRGQ